MGDRGRKSKAELAVISGGGVQTTTRPHAPAWLTDEQAEEWRAVVNSKPADHFTRDVWPMLEGYCQHTVSLRHIRQLISAAEENEPEIQDYDRLLKMQERESRCIASLAVRLGIAQTTADAPKKQKHSPWEFKK